MKIAKTLATVFYLTSVSAYAVIAPPTTPAKPPMQIMSDACQQGGAMDTVVFSCSDYVIGFDMFTQDFHISQSGSYQATLTDFDFPNEFDYIGFMISHGPHKMGSVEGSGSFNFNAMSGDYTAWFVGSVGSDEIMPGSMGKMPHIMPPIGSYYVQVAMVPELETWAMFAIGLGAMGWWYRRQRRQETGSNSLIPASV